MRCKKCPMAKDECCTICDQNDFLTAERPLPDQDELLAQAGQEMDLEKRKALYAEFQKIVVDDAPIYYLNVIPYKTIAKKGVVGIPDGIWGAVAPMDELNWE